MARGGKGCGRGLGHHDCSLPMLELDSVVCSGNDLTEFLFST